MEQLEKDYAETFIVREYARSMRFKSRQESDHAIEALRQRMGFATGGWRPRPTLLFLAAIERHCRQFVDRGGALAFLLEVVEAAAEFPNLDKESRQKVAFVRSELEEIRKYNEDRFGGS